MSVTTVSNVLASSINELERTKLLRWCEVAALSGGSFAIETHYYTSNWFIRYTINWPDEAPTDLQSKGGKP